MANFEKVPHFNSRSCQILLFNIGYFLGKSITLQEQKTNTKENKLTENFFLLFWMWAFFPTPNLETLFPNFQSNIVRGLV